MTWVERALYVLFGFGFYMLLTTWVDGFNQFLKNEDPIRAYIVLFVGFASLCYVTGWIFVSTLTTNKWVNQQKELIRQAQANFSLGNEPIFKKIIHLQANALKKTKQRKKK